MKGAIVYGSAMASFCVEEFGPEKLLALKKPEIAKRVKMFSTLSKFSIKG